MRGYLRSIIWLCLALVLAGCVISSSPDPSQTVVMYPGDTENFSVLASKYTNGYLPPIGETETEWYVDYTYQKYDDYKSSFVYTAPASPGRHKVRVDIGLSQFCIDCPSGPYEFLSMQNITWNVDVNGVIPQPAEDSLTMSPNTTQDFAVQAWPEDGSYSYAWYLDGVLQTGVGTSVFTYAPACGDPGDHTLTVKVSGWGKTFPEDTKTWNIHVRTTTPVPNDSHLVRHPGETQDLAVNTCADPAEYRYVWYVDDQIVSGAESNTFAYTQDTLGCRLIKVEVIRGEVKDVYSWHVDFSKADAWVKPLVVKELPYYQEGFILTHTGDGALILYSNLQRDEILLEFYDLNGTCIRSLNYGTSLIGYAAAIGRTSDGGYILVGLQSTSTRYLDAYAAKLDNSGQVLWQKSYVTEATNDNCIVRVRQASDGSYMIGVTWSPDECETEILKINADGSLAKNLTLASQGVCLLTSDGGFLTVTGSYSSRLINKYSQDGLLAWSFSFTGLLRVLQASTNELFVMVENGYGHVLYKLSPDGTVLWKRDDINLSWGVLSSTITGGFVRDYTIGEDQDLPGFICHGEYDIGIIKYDSNAEIEQYVQIGGSNDDFIRYIEQAPDGSYVAIGYTNSTDFPGMLLPGYFIMHLPPTW